MTLLAFICVFLILIAVSDAYSSILLPPYLGQRSLRLPLLTLNTFNKAIQTSIAEFCFRIPLQDYLRQPAGVSRQ